MLPRALAGVCGAALMGLALVASGAPAQPAAFTDVTPPSMLDDMWGEGVAWGDFDNDGDLDLLVSNEGQLLRLFRNNDDGTFTLATPASMSAPGNWTGIAWGDYDNDGDIDVFAAQAETPKHLFRNEGGGVFTDVMPAAIANDSSHVHGVSWVDYDQDGDLDLFFACAPSVFRPNAPAGEHLLRNDGGSVFINVTPAALDDPQYGRGCSWADFDNDGDPDLCVANFGTTRLYRNDGGGVFVDVAAGAMLAYGHGGGVTWGDYDNDGDMDLYIAKAFSAVGRLYRNEGNGSFSEVTPPILQQYCIGAQWGDYDNDGDLDLYLGNATAGQPNVLARNDGGGAFSNVTNPALADTDATLGFGWGDYDGDGDLDLYLANSQGRPDRLLRNDTQNGNHWLQLDLIGAQSNRSAIGARIEAWAGGQRRIREVDGGSGYNSQNTLRVHFGLGAATGVDSIRIRWPSGIVQDTVQVGVDRLVRIRERDTRLGVPAPSPVGLALATPAPNPFGGTARITYRVPVATAGALRVLDLQGRAVRTLDRGPLAPGSHHLIWDGSDDAGRPTPPGVYRLRLRTPAATIERTLIRIE